LFDFVYPGHRAHVPQWVRERLYQQAKDEIDTVGDPKICCGTMISRFSYTIDVNEWGFRDPRKELTLAARNMPVVQEIVAADIWEPHPTQKKTNG
jgi:hypothetical protein